MPSNAFGNALAPAAPAAGRHSSINSNAPSADHCAPNAQIENQIRRLHETAAHNIKTSLIGSLLLYFLLVSQGCTSTAAVTIRNYAPHDTELICWNDDPSVALWRVVVPKHSHVRFDFVSDRIGGRTNGGVLLGIDSEDSFTVRVANKEFQKEKLIQSTLSAMNLEANESRRLDGRRYNDIIITEDDLILLTHPKNLDEIELVQLSEEPSSS